MDVHSLETRSDNHSVEVNIGPINTTSVSTALLSPSGSLPQNWHVFVNKETGEKLFVDTLNKIASTSPPFYINLDSDNFANYKPYSANNDIKEKRTTSSPSFLNDSNDPEEFAHRNKIAHIDSSKDIKDPKGGVFVWPSLETVGEINALQNFCFHVLGKSPVYEQTIYRKEIPNSKAKYSNQPQTKPYFITLLKVDSIVFARTIESSKKASKKEAAILAIKRLQYLQNQGATSVSEYLNPEYWNTENERQEQREKQLQEELKQNFEESLKLEERFADERLDHIPLIVDMKLEVQHYLHQQSDQQQQELSSSEYASQQSNSHFPLFIRTREVISGIFDELANSSK